MVFFNRRVALAFSALLLMTVSCRLVNRMVERPADENSPQTAGPAMQSTAFPMPSAAPTSASLADQLRPADEQSTPPALPEIDIPNAVMDFYEISGATEEELVSQLNELSPTGMDGSRWIAYTRWNYYWNWPGYGSNTCSLQEAKVTYDVTVTFPHWNPPPEASPELVANWSRFITVLAEHEKVHVDNVNTSYAQVEKAIKEATCDTADAAAHDALDLIQKRDDDYDAETSHGATQGAVFP